MKLSDWVVKSNKTAYRLINGEAIILTPEDSMLHSLEGVAARIWELIDKKVKIDWVVSKICEEYEVENETAEKEIVQFLEELQNKGLVIIEKE